MDSNALDASGSMEKKVKRMTTAITRMSDRAETCELREKENVKPTTQGPRVVTACLEPKVPMVSHELLEHARRRRALFA